MHTYFSVRTHRKLKRKELHNHAECVRETRLAMENSSSSSSLRFAGCKVTVPMLGHVPVVGHSYANLFIPKLQASFDAQTKLCKLQTQTVFYEIRITLLINVAWVSSYSRIVEICDSVRNTYIQCLTIDLSKNRVYRVVHWGLVITIINRGVLESRNYRIVESVSP